MIEHFFLIFLFVYLALTKYCFWRIAQLLDPSAEQNTLHHLHNRHSVHNMLIVFLYFCDRFAKFKLVRNVFKSKSLNWKKFRLNILIWENSQLRVLLYLIMLQKRTNRHIPPPPRCVGIKRKIPFSIFRLMRRAGWTLRFL